MSALGGTCLVNKFQTVLFRISIWPVTFYAGETIQMVQLLCPLFYDAVINLRKYRFTSKLGKDVAKLGSGNHCVLES